MTTTFRGSLTRPEGGLPAWAEVRVLAPGLRVQTREGQIYELPYADLEVDSGGFEGNVVFCRSRTTGVSVQIGAEKGDASFLVALRTYAPELAPAAAAAEKKIVKHRRGRVIGMAVTLVVALIVGAIVYQAPAMLAASVEGLPMSIDRQIGDAAFHDMRAELSAEVAAPVVVGFVETLVARLGAAAPGVEFRVHVVRDDTVNAFALPGGQIVVFTGLLAKARRPEEVAGVLAHEMAHVTRRHGLRNAALSAGTRVALLLLLGDEGWGALAGDVAAFTRENAYSREQESDADAEGARMLHTAGLDPEGLASFFELLKGEAGSELRGFANWFSTHPEHDARIAHVRAVAAGFGTPALRPLEVDWRAVQASLPGAGLPGRTP